MISSSIASSSFEEQPIGFTSATPEAQKQKQKQKQEERSCMEQLADAYCTVVQALADGVQKQMESLPELERLDEQMSKAIILQADENIKKRTEILHMLQAADAQVEKVNDILGIGNTLMIIMGVVAILSGVGGVLAGLAAETVATAAAEGAAEAAAEGAAAGAAEAAAEAGEQAAVQAAAEAGAAVPEAEAGIAEEVVENAENVAKEYNLPKMAVCVAGSGVLAAPQIYGGIQQNGDGFGVEGIAQKKEKIAAYQRVVTEGNATVKQYESYFSFYQQSVERALGVVNNVAEEMGNAVTCATTTFDAYKQVAATLGRKR